MKTKLAILLTLVITIITATFFSLSALAQTPPYQFPQYGPATVLLEDTGASTTELLPVNLRPNSGFGFFYIMEENDVYYLWLSSSYSSGAIQDSLVQRLESQDGLIWHNRTDTNLEMHSNSYRSSSGIRHIIKSGNTYEGWEEYFYTVVVGGWAVNTRYITSTNGITWTVASQSPMETARSLSLIKEGGIYHIWANPGVDPSYDPDWNLRYRTSSNGGSGWGHWKTGGAVVNVDGSPQRWTSNRLRRGSGGTYEYFFKSPSGINLATSPDGITFTTQITDLIKFSEVFTTSVNVGDFLVIEVQGEDWFYFTYNDQDGHSHIAVSRPIYPDLSLHKTVTPSAALPGEWLTYTLTFSNIGNSIATHVTITDIVPSLLTNLHVSSSSLLTDTGHTPAYVWQLPNLAPGTGGTITLTGQVDSTWTGHINVTNVATITATSLETNTNNNHALANATIRQSLTSTYLPLILKSYPPVTFPVHIGDAIASRPVTHQGETFYNVTRQVPDLPAGGRFYLSSQPNSLAPVLVDDEIVLLLNGTPVFAYDFSSHGSPQAATLAVPRPTMEQIAGRTITVEYRDIYGVVVQASPVWLIWLP